MKPGDFAWLATTTGPAPAYVEAVSSTCILVCVYSETMGKWGGAVWVDEGRMGAPLTSIECEALGIRLGKGGK